jgi:hypothetical protein
MKVEERNENTILELMKLPNSVMIGSRGLDLGGWEDTDICVLRSELPESYNNIGRISPIKKYFRIVPEGENYVIRSFKLDVLVFEDLKVLDCVRDAMADVKAMPPFALQGKFVRVKLYESALIYHLKKNGIKFTDSYVQERCGISDGFDDDIAF